MFHALSEALVAHGPIGPGSGNQVMGLDSALVRTVSAAIKTTAAGLPHGPTRIAGQARRDPGQWGARRDMLRPYPPAWTEA
jgi:hypothetical protein